MHDARAVIYDRVRVVVGRRVGHTSRDDVLARRGIVIRDICGKIKRMAVCAARDRIAARAVVLRGVRHVVERGGIRAAKDLVCARRGRVCCVRVGCEVGGHRIDAPLLDQDARIVVHLGVAIVVQRALLEHAARGGEDAVRGALLHIELGAVVGCGRVGAAGVVVRAAGVDCRSGVVVVGKRICATRREPAACVLRKRSLVVVSINRVLGIAVLLIIILIAHETAARCTGVGRLEGGSTVVLRRYRAIAASGNAAFGRIVTVEEGLRDGEACTLSVRGGLGSVT